MPIEKQFQIDLGIDTNTGHWHVHLYSLSDKKVLPIKGNKFGPLLKRALEMVRKKELHNRKFPITQKEPPRILTLNGDRHAPSLIMPNANGKKPTQEPRIIIPDGS